MDIINLIHNDSSYGFNGTSGTFKWVQAFNGGTSSQKYQDILTYFQGKNSKFTSDMMAQIAGDKSFFLYLNRTYTYKLVAELHTGSRLDAAALLASQWGQRFVTKNPKILLFDDPTVPQLETIYDLYNEEADSEFPNNFDVPYGFAPELNYFLEKNMSYDTSLASLDTATTKGLLLKETGIKGQQTLMNPANLQFFYEKYKLGDFEAIKSRFRIDGGQPLNNNHVIGIKGYLDMLIAKLIDSNEQNPDFNQYMAFGSWVSLALKNSYAQVLWNVERQGMARFINAYMQINSVENCTLQLAPLNNASKIKTICDKYPFDTDRSAPSEGIYLFALAHDVSDVSADLMAKTDINFTDLGLLYGPSAPLSTAIAATKAILATHYNCSSQTACTTEELALKQWSNSSLTQFITQPNQLSGNQALGADSLSISDSWPNTTMGIPFTEDQFFYPEFRNFYDNTYGYPT
jgi:hypothetical protein